MRALALACLLLTFARAASAAERCTPEWAVELARSNHSTTRAEAEAAITPIATCPNKLALYEAINRQPPRPPDAPPAPVVEPEPKSSSKGKRASGSAGSAPARTTDKKDSGAVTPSQPSGKSTPGTRAKKKTPATAPNESVAGKQETTPVGAAASSTASPDSVDRLIYAASLSAVKLWLLERMAVLQKSCRGFAECPTSDLRDWLEKFGGYLESVRAKDAPEDVIREAGELISKVADKSPEFRMAEVVAKALERMSPEQKADFAKKFPRLEAAFKEESATARIKALLEQAADLGTAYAQVASMGASQFAVGGRPVIASLRLEGLAGVRCVKKLGGQLTAAFRRHLPIGMLIYGAQAYAPDIVLSASLVAPAADSACKGEPDTRCVRIDAKVHSGASQSREPLVFHSNAFRECQEPERADFDELASETLGSFAVSMNAQGTSVEEAQLIRAGCVELVSKGDKAFSNALVSVREKGRHFVYLPAEDSKDWPGFAQELAASLAPHSRILGTVSNLAPQAGFSGTSLSWTAKWTPKAAFPDEVTLRLHWNGTGGPPDADLTVTPKHGRKECSFAALSFKQTVAAQAAFWLLGMSFRDTPRRSDKNWWLSPLGLLLAGLPQFVDDDPGNDTRGAILAGIDVALLTTAGILVLSSVDARSDYSNSQDQADLERANDLLHAGYWVGGAVIVPRIISIAW